MPRRHVEGDRLGVLLFQYHFLRNLRGSIGLKGDNVEHVSCDASASATEMSEMEDG